MPKRRLHALFTRLKPVVLALIINIGLLGALDLLLVKFDLLSPPLQYGLSDLGFGYSGVRTSKMFGGSELDEAASPLTIAMIGDSHSQLVFPNPLDSHEFVLERDLRARGFPVSMISAGRGRYSPLQEYLLFKNHVKGKYRPQVLLLNFYSGNDFYDMLRPDDRPHYVREDGGAITMRPPRWISFVDPESRSWVQRSRLLWGVDELANTLGYPRVVTRLRMLSAAANQSSGSLAETVRYLRNLASSQEPTLAYPAAFAAQILNQALYFQHFPESKADSIVFMRHLLAQIRAENPDLVLVLAAIPSAAVMNGIPADLRQAWKDTLDRTGLSAEKIAQLENELVDQLEASAAPAGWQFIDLRDCLGGRFSSGNLYSPEDLHISAAASRMIGECQAQAFLSSAAFVRLTGGARHSSHDDSRSD